MFLYPWTLVKLASRLARMTNERRRRSPSDVVGARVRELRRARGWTTDQLAARCAELGAPELTNQVLFNIEAGRPDKEKRRRRLIAVEELLVLAQALDVSPADLLGGDGEDYPFPIGGGSEGAAARAWIRGQEPLDPADRRSFFSHMPARDFYAEALDRLHGRPDLQAMYKRALEDGAPAGALPMPPRRPLAVHIEAVKRYEAAQEQEWSTWVATQDIQQRSMLPEHLPELDRYRIAARYDVGVDGNAAGGDFYDAFTLADGRLAMALGDVAGHDVHAAALMGQVRAALRALALADPEPTAVLTGLDR